MLNIVLLCEMGASTSILEGRMNDYAKENNLDIKVEAFSMHDIEKIINSGKRIDYIFLGPQVAYKMNTFIQKYGHYNIPISSISFNDYAMMDGAAVIKKALEALNEKSIS